MNKIIGIAWFTSGIVLCETEYDGKKAYIKNIYNPSGIESDAIEIAQYGARFPLKEAESIIKNEGGPVDIKY